MEDWVIHRGVKNKGDHSTATLYFAISDNEYQKKCDGSYYFKF